MKLLWLVNIALPEISVMMNEKPTPYGGWLIQTSTMLSDRTDIELSIAFPSIKIDHYKMYQGKKITYYVFSSSNKKNQFTELKEIINASKPDVVHIFGTEYSHTRTMTEILNQQNIPYVTSIQGLISTCEQHYMASLPMAVQKSMTLRDFLRHDSLKLQQEKFKKRGIDEIESIKMSKNVIGRTTFDYAAINQINPNINYHFNNETLRPSFYNHSWNIERLDEHKLFTSQAYYPIKGLHHMIQAFAIILKNYPNSRLYIAGDPLIKSNKLLDRLKQSGYAKYIKKLTIENNLEGKVIYTGTLNEKEMVEQYLSSSLFVCPSSIENSSNSIGEAMLLGVPTVASYVGGNIDMIRHGKDGFLYQHDAPYMLAYYVNKLFENHNLTKSISLNARENALKRYDPQLNYKTLLEIYKKIR